MKRLTAEQVHDAIAVASGIPGLYTVSRTMRGLRFAMQFPDVVDTPPARRFEGIRTFLSAFFPGDREETPRSGDGSPLQALQLMNSVFVNQRLNAGLGTGTLSEVVDLADDALVTSLYLRVLSRPPTTAELAIGVNHVASGDRVTQASGLMWALLNKTDFYFNY